MLIIYSLEIFQTKGLSSHLELNRRANQAEKSHWESTNQSKQSLLLQQTTPITVGLIINMVFYSSHHISVEIHRGGCLQSFKHLGTLSIFSAIFQGLPSPQSFPSSKKGKINYQRIIQDNSGDSTRCNIHCFCLYYIRQHLITCCPQPQRMLRIVIFLVAQNLSIMQHCLYLECTRGVHFRPINPIQIN